MALLRVQGDNPYLSKLANTCGTASYFACKWCYVQGTNTVPTPNGLRHEKLPAMRTGGYTKEFPCRMLTLHQAPNGQWRWKIVEQHCLRKEDGTLDDANGALLVTTPAARARAAKADAVTARADVLGRAKAEEAAAHPDPSKRKTGGSNTTTQSMIYCLPHDAPASAEDMFR